METFFVDQIKSNVYFFLYGIVMSLYIDSKIIFKKDFMKMENFKN